MKELSAVLTILLVGFLVAILPVIALIVVSVAGCDLGNESEGGLIMLPLYCIFTVPAALLFCVVAIIMRWMRN